MFIRSPRPPTFDGIVETTVLPKKRQWPEIFGTLKKDLNYLVGPVFKWSSFRPYEFVVQRVSRAMAKVMKSPVHASLHVFSKTFCPKLDLLWNIYRFLSAGDCHHGNRLVSAVFKLCKRIIRPIEMTSFCKNPRILQCILTSAWKCLSLISRFFLFSHLSIFPLK